MKWLADEYVRIDCFDDTNSWKNLQNLTPKFFKSTVRAKIVQLNGCSLPLKSYASTFSTLNIDVQEIEEFMLHQTSDEPLRMAHMENLNIRFLNVSYSPKLIDVAPTFLEPLTTMEILYVKSMGLKALSQTLRLYNIKLMEGKSEGPFGECSELRYLHLSRWDVREVSDFWLANCTQLEALRLVEMVNMSSIHLERVLKGVTSLTSVTVRHCNLTIIKEDQMLLKDAKAIQHLDFSNNNLQYFAM